MRMTDRLGRAEAAAEQHADPGARLHVHREGETETLRWLAPGTVVIESEGQPPQFIGRATVVKTLVGQSISEL